MRDAATLSKRISRAQRELVLTARRSGGVLHIRGARSAFALVDKGILKHEGVSTQISCGVQFRLTDVGQEVAAMLATGKGKGKDNE